MDSNGCIEINLKGDIDSYSGENIAVRIQAAIRNGVKKIILKFEKETNVTSAGFLAFLVDTTKIMKSNRQKFTIKGVNKKVEVLLNMSRLTEFIEN